MTHPFQFFYIFVYTYTCNDMRSVMLQINEYDDDVVMVSMLLIDNFEGTVYNN